MFIIKSVANDPIKLDVENLENLKMSDINLHRALLEGTSIRNLKGSNINFSGVFLIRVDFTTSNILECSFIHTHCYNSVFNKVNLEKVNGLGIIAFGTQFIDAKLLKCDFQYGDFTDANFRGATIDNCNMSNCKVLGANLLNTKIIDTNLNNTEYDRFTIFSR